MVDMLIVPAKRGICSRIAVQASCRQKHEPLSKKKLKKKEGWHWVNGSSGRALAWQA
jgi:hypothetical protein